MTEPSTPFQYPDDEPEPQRDADSGVAMAALGAALLGSGRLLLDRIGKRACVLLWMLHDPAFAGLSCRELSVKLNTSAATICGISRELREAFPMCFPSGKSIEARAKLSAARRRRSS